MKKISSIIKRIILYVFRYDIETLSSAFASSIEAEFFYSLAKFRMLYFACDILNETDGYMIFLIDKSGTIVPFDKLNIKIHVKKIFLLSSKDFKFIKCHKQFFPENLVNQRFLKYCINEFLSYPIHSIIILLLSSFLFFNNNLILVEKLVSANLSIITIFVSIYLVFINLLYARNSRGKINDFFSGKFHKMHEDNKNMLFMALLSIALSLLCLVVINIRVVETDNIIVQLGNILGRKSISIILSSISLLCTCICFFNIVEYYLKSHKYEFYEKSIDTIIQDQKQLEE